MNPMPETTPVGGRMSYWIAYVLQAERQRAGLTRQQVAAALEAHEHTVRRLEEGRSMGRDIDRAIAAYAYLLGLDDGRELWDQAMQAWYKHGSPPQHEKISSPAAAFAEAIRSASLRHRQDAGERSEKHAATQTRQAVK